MKDYICNNTTVKQLKADYKISVNAIVKIQLEAMQAVGKWKTYQRLPD